MIRWPEMLTGLAAIGAVALATAPLCQADNARLNKSVVSNVYTTQRHAGCTNTLTTNPQLQLAAQWHTNDVLNNRSLDGDVGSDGSTPQDRARAAGFAGTVVETVAINPAIAISGIELMNMWYGNPDYLKIMQDCRNTAIGVWSENSLDHTVVVAVYGRPENDAAAGHAVDLGAGPTSGGGAELLDPSPDYDASDEIEYGLNWLPWILRGVYPPPAYPPA
jgi:uncharacterized protein YkwD